jgi:hypothetical protein
VDTTAGVYGQSFTTLKAALESRLSLLSRVCTAAGCWYDIDRTGKKVYVRLNSETRGTGPNIGASDVDWWDLVYTQDAAQVRNKAYVGAKPTALGGMNASYVGPPVAPALVDTYDAVLDGNDIVTLSSEGAAAGAITSVSVAAAKGATSFKVPLGGMTGWSAAGWVLVAGQYVYYGSASNDGTNDIFATIPASGSGSIAVDLPVGSSVVSVAYRTLSGVTTTPSVYPASLQVIRSASSTSATYGTIEVSISDGSYAIADALLRAQNEVAAWKDPTISGRVTTTDATAIAGYNLVIDVFGLSQTMRIERVTSSWDMGKSKMVHVCEFATKRRDLVNLLLDLSK